MQNRWYPLRFTPILKEKVWGGSQLKELLHKTKNSALYGESWEVAALPEDQSVISNGDLTGKTLGEVVDAFAKAVLGPSVAQRFDSTFPLLIKFIDAADDLSIQLHPNDTIAQEKHNGWGKTEMWYILHADPGATLTIGFKERIPEDVSVLEQDDILDYLKTYEVAEGDVFYIPAGLIHAIGKGVVLAEIQQASDTTYRVFDYNRPEADGSLRDLHLEDAKEAIVLQQKEEPQIMYDRSAKVATLKHCPYFKTDLVQLADETHAVARTNSFTVVMCIAGTITLEQGPFELHLKKGETALLPAACDVVQIIGVEAKFLEVYL